MELNVIGSNSLGNCYILQNSDEALVIECGCEIKKVVSKIGFMVSKLSGALVTHEHNDHVGFVKEFATYGVNVLALPEVFSSHGLSDNPFCHEITVGKSYKVGGFICQSFSVHHDVPCVGWLIKHQDIGKLVFATDTTFVDYNFNGLTQIMIEANYIDEIVDRRIAEGDERMAKSRNRLLRSHMELEATKTFLRNNDLSKVDNIILIHLSDGNSDEERMIREVRQLSGCRVFAADKDMTINLNY